MGFYNRINDPYPFQSGAEKKRIITPRPYYVHMLGGSTRNYIHFSVPTRALELMRMPIENYVSRKTKLLKDFDKSVSRVKPLLISRYGEEQTIVLKKESRLAYETIIPQIPYIGGKNPFLIFLLPAARYLAVYRAFRKIGKTVEEAGQLIYDMGEAEIKAIPSVIRRVMAYLWFCPWFLKRLKKRATASQTRKYPGGYVLSFVEGNGQDFDYGIDYTECAACKFLSAQNALELAPYVCAVDKVASEMMGWGLSRKMTLADGYDKCDFRFKKGGETELTIPQSLMPAGESKTA